MFLSHQKSYAILQIPIPKYIVIPVEIAGEGSHTSGRGIEGENGRGNV